MEPRRRAQEILDKLSWPYVFLCGLLVLLLPFLWLDIAGRWVQIAVRVVIFGGIWAGVYRGREISKRGLGRRGKSHELTARSLVEGFVTAGLLVIPAVLLASYWR